MRAAAAAAPSDGERETDNGHFFCQSVSHVGASKIIIAGGSCRAKKNPPQTGHRHHAHVKAFTFQARLSFHSHPPLFRNMLGPRSKTTHALGADHADEGEREPKRAKREERAHAAPLAPPTDSALASVTQWRPDSKLCVEYMYHA